jgi:DNA repair protein RecO (recombination protein O)
VTALTTTDAIVLKTMKYRDTSSIVTFYTRAYGKLRGIAKAARDRKNRFGAGLQPLGRVTLVFYMKEHRELHLISQCDVRVPAHAIRNDLRRTAAALACLELLDQVTHDSEQNEPLFSLIDVLLERIDATSADPEILLFAFKLRLAGLMGFAPDLSACVSCGAECPQEGDGHAVFEVSRGALVCERCAARTSGGLASVRLTGGAVALLRSLQYASWSAVEALAPDEELRNEIRETLRLYLRYHIENLKPLRSEQLLLNP